MFQLYNTLNYLFELREVIFKLPVKTLNWRKWDDSVVGTFIWIRPVSMWYSAYTCPFWKGYLPSANEVAGRQCFHRWVSVSSQGGGRVGMLHESWNRSHGRVPFSPLPDIKLGDLPPHPDIRSGNLPPSNIRPGDLPLPLPLTSVGDHWRPVQTCSLEDLPSTGTDI